YVLPPQNVPPLSQLQKISFLSQQQFSNYKNQNHIVPLNGDEVLWTRFFCYYCEVAKLGSTSLLVA
uniref:Ovule protein n=1 Tax=Romanomermis culicivorax TaxID=13658 RepID=A0A915L082_ROMCU